ncbi:DnaD domain protein [Carnobacterium sp. CS13]|uniref:DnaD domain protein n=1 Tax=Carnobacterium sp. CS13 TaxID=2800128 RepID=UPI001914CA01|nr:DnaD domain protein [Carnobacterium sp. CS13]QQP71181.1 DnaD domain protein [Carnobacterium sp. CS13]
MSDKLKLEGVMSKGYGTVPKLVMQDEELAPEAKAIYAYICSFAGAGTSAFPGIDLMCKQLTMSEKRFHRYKNQLIENGYLRIERERKSDGKGWGSNIYHLVQEVPEKKTVTGQNDMIQPVTGQFVTLQNVTRQDVTLQNDCTNNNSFNNNSSINNSIKNKQQQPTEEKRPNCITSWEQNGYGMISPLNMEKLDNWIVDFGDSDEAEEIVCRAIDVAADQGVRKYAYVNTILKNWEDKGVKSLDDIDALEKEREAALKAKKSAPKNNYTKQPIRKETMPEWHGKPEVNETPMDSAAREELQARLNKIRAFKKTESE